MSTRFGLAAFVMCSLALMYLSRAPLRNPRSHGFYRLFAWEAILALIVLNLDVWFRKPLSFPQLASWLCLCVSGFLVLDGIYLLRSAGKPNRTRADAALFGIEKTTALVAVGVYRYIRHPIYSSLLCLAWGAFLKSASWPGVALVLSATGFLITTAKVEEMENVRYFGVEYRAYMKKTKMFIPFLI